jgi:hypothetical protein
MGPATSKRMQWLFRISSRRQENATKERNGKKAKGRGQEDEEIEVRGVGVRGRGDEGNSHG